jgi:hypothetical protein
MRIRLFAFGCALGSATRMFFSNDKVEPVANLHFQQAATMIQEKLYLDMAKEQQGCTPTYFPENLPVVLKHCGFGVKGVTHCTERLAQMETARALCQQLGLSHLVIPKAEQYEDFLIEDRLPIKVDALSLENTGLYLQNKDKFTTVIRQMTTFLYSVDLEDIKDHQAETFWNILSPTPKSDNLPLYLENGEGKIGLIDLEELRIPRRRPFLDNVKLMISFFPYHFEDILDAAKKADPSIHRQIEEEKRELQKTQTLALTAYDRIYLGHVKFLQDHGISRANGGKMPIWDQKTREEIAQTLRNEFLQRYQRIHAPPHIEQAERQARIYNNTLDAIQMIHELYASKIKGCKDSEIDLVRCRSISTHFTDYNKVNGHFASAFNNKDDAGGISERIIEELQRKGLIYFFSENGLVRL